MNNINNKNDSNDKSTNNKNKINHNIMKQTTIIAIKTIINLLKK